MLLTHKFTDFQLNLTLELFLRILSDFFRKRLVSVVLYGSVVFDDLAPGYGDLDFLVVVDDNLSDETCRQLVEIRKPLRSGDYGILAKMLEGAFLPRPMLNPIKTGKAFWWGTSGERHWESNQLGWFVLYVIRERGIIIWGEDIQHEIPVADREKLLKDVWLFCRNMRRYPQVSGSYSVDWLLTAARFLLWLKENRLSSKSESADWGYLHARGTWREFLPRAKQIRLNPALADSPDLKQWFDELNEFIVEACEEIENELALQGFQYSATSDNSR